jgi:membrane-bound lytic murein transglycosylase D
MYFWPVVIAFLLSIAARGQDFFLATDKVFASSTSQWLCTELEKGQPGYYSSTIQARMYYRPSEMERSLVPAELLPDSSTQLQFYRLYFPEAPASLGRFQKLKALTDLYIPLIDKQLMLYKLPREWKYLALILSGLSPVHTSADGRAGIWSLDYYVARSYGLRIDELVDERRGGDFTSLAAIQYLSDLYIQFESDPVPVILAYTQSMAAAKYWMTEESKQVKDLSQQQTLILQFLAYSTALFHSTSTPHQLNACFDILGQFDPVRFEAPVAYKALEVLLAQRNDALRAMNPVFYGNIVPGNYIRVPFMLDKAAAARYVLLKDSIYQWKPSSPEVKPVTEDVVFHTVRRGESLGSIAKKYKVSVQRLKQWNHIRKDRIDVGQRLKIIRPGKKVAPPSSTEESSTSAPREQQAPQSTAKPAGQKDTALVHTVRSGDSLWKISRKYGVTERQIKQWNKCGDDLRPGQKLKIYRNKR